MESDGGKPVYFWFRRFPYDVRLLSTLHKIQDKTIDSIILQLNQRRGSLMPINMFGLLVALSRVTHGNNIRILPPHEGESIASFLANLKELRPCPYLSRWRQGITENGSWQHRAQPTLDPKQTRKPQDTQLVVTDSVSKGSEDSWFFYSSDCNDGSKCFSIFDVVPVAYATMACDKLQRRQRNGIPRC